MSAPKLRLHHDPAPDDALPSALGAAREQATDAEIQVHRDGHADFLRLPWPSVDALVDGIGAGEVWFVGGFSGTGKTTWLMNLVQLWLAAGKCVYYVGTETVPHEIRTRLACVRQHVYAGDVLSGRAAREYAHWPAVRDRLVADIRAQRDVGSGHELLVHPVQRIHAGSITAAYHEAALSNADVLVLDHIDHAEHGAGRTGYEDSKMLAHHILDCAQGQQVRTLVATQLNNEVTKAGDPLARYRMPEPHHVFMGGHKRQIAWGMLGLFRPLRPDLTMQDIKRIRARTARAKDYVEPDVLAVGCMKHRHHGSHEGDVALLSYDRGRLVELAEKDRYGTSYEDTRRV